MKERLFSKLWKLVVRHAVALGVAFSAATLLPNSASAGRLVTCNYYFVQAHDTITNAVNDGLVVKPYDARGASRGSTSLVAEGDTFKFTVTPPPGTKVIQRGDVRTDAQFAPTLYTMYEWEDWGDSLKPVTYEWKNSSSATSTAFISFLFDCVSFDLNFNANGGDGAMTTLQNNALTDLVYPDSFALPLNTFTKAGYHFKEWKCAGNNQTFQDGASTTGGAFWNSGRYEFYTELLAQWEPNTYQVKFVANGGTGTMADMACEYDQTCAWPKCGFVRDGYGFVSWNSREDGTGKEYRPDEEFRNLKEADGAELTVYAQWTQTRFGISVELGNGEVRKLQYDTSNAVQAVTIEVPVSNGYYVASWKVTGASGAEPSVTGDQLTIPAEVTGDLHLVPVWQPNPYRIEYALGADVEPNGSLPVAAKVDAVFTVGVPERENYEFAGWTLSGTNADYTTAKWGTSANNVVKPITNSAAVFPLDAEGGLYLINLTREYNGLVTLTPQWRELPVYAIEYELGEGGIAGSRSPTTGQLDGDAFTIGAPTRDGFDFAGWMLKGDDPDYTTACWGIGSDGAVNRILATTIFGAGRDSVYVTRLSSTRDGKVKLVAQWTVKPVTNYTIEYSLGEGGVAGGTSPTDIDELDKIVTISAPSRAGYVFAGWMLKGDDADYDHACWGVSSGGVVNRIHTDTVFGADHSSVYVRNLTATGNGKVVLEAQWTAVVEVGYEIYVEGGSANPNMYQQSSEKQYVIISLTAKPGYAVSEWTISGAEGSRQPVVRDNVLIIPADTKGDLTLKPSTWEPIQYAVNYEFGTDAVSGYYGLEEATYDEDFLVSAPIWSGHTFYGWTLEGDDANYDTARWGFPDNAGDTYYEGQRGVVNKIRDTTDLFPRVVTNEVWLKNLTTVPNGSVTLRAVWDSPELDYTISVIDGTASPNRYLKAATNQWIRLTPNTTNWVVRGYKGGVPTIINGTMTIPAGTYGNLTLYNAEEKVQTRKLTLIDDLMGTTNQIEVELYKPLKDLTEYGCSVPSTNGCQFAGYYAEPKGKGDRFFDENGRGVGNWDRDENATLYAFWTVDVTMVDPSMTHANYVVTLPRGGGWSNDYLPDWKKNGESPEGWVPSEISAEAMLTNNTLTVQWPQKVQTDSKKIADALDMTDEEFSAIQDMVFDNASDVVKAISTNYYAKGTNSIYRQSADNDNFAVAFNVTNKGILSFQWRLIKCIDGKGKFSVCVDDGTEVFSASAQSDCFTSQTIVVTSACKVSFSGKASRWCLDDVHWIPDGGFPPGPEPESVRTNVVTVATDPDGYGVMPKMDPASGLIVNNNEITVSVDSDRFLYWKKNGVRYSDQNPLTDDPDTPYDPVATRTVYTAVFEVESKVNFNDGTETYAADADPVVAGIYQQPVYGQVPSNLLALPTREHYRFLGFYDDAGKQLWNEIGVWQSGEAWTSTNSSTTVTAQWQPVDITVQYKVIGNGKGSVNAQTCSYTSEFQVAAFDGTAPAGYLFAGWKTNQSDTVVAYAPGDITSPVSNRTLIVDNKLIFYTAWTAGVYHVSFDGNGANTGAMAVQTFAFDEVQALASNRYAKTGCQFLGWSQTPDTTIVTYQDGEEVVNLPGAELGQTNTLYAIWQLRQGAIQFDANGMVVAELPKTQSFAMDSLPVVLKASFDPECTGYQFGGWNPKADGSGTNYWAGDVITAEALAEMENTNDVYRLYAQWSPVWDSTVYEWTDSSTGRSWKYRNYGDGADCWVVGLAAVPGQALCSLPALVDGKRVVAVGATGTAFGNSDSIVELPATVTNVVASSFQGIQAVRFLGDRPAGVQDIANCWVEVPADNVTWTDLGASQRVGYYYGPVEAMGAKRCYFFTNGVGGVEFAYADDQTEFSGTLVEQIEVSGASLKVTGVSDRCPQKCTIWFGEGDHGSFVSGQPVQTLVRGMDSVPPTVAASNGWEFAGWDQPVTQLAGDTMATAAYTQTVYAIIYEGLKEGVTNSNPTTYTVTDAITFAPLGRITGWQFAGWTPSNIVAGTTGDLKVTAQWEQVAQHTVTFVVGEHGQRSGGGELVQTVEDGAAATAPTVAADAGWKFTGWDREFAAVTEDMTVNARYDETPYAITYDNLKGAANPNPTVYTVTDALTFAPLAAVEGYDFVGWTPAGIAAGTTGDLKVTAQWQAYNGIVKRGTWPLTEDGTVTIMQGESVANWTFQVPSGAKVTVTGLPSGLKYKNGEITGAATKAKEFTVTFKTTKDGQTTTEKVTMYVEANAWTGSWYGVQTNDWSVTLGATVTAAAGGSVKLILTEGTKKTTFSAKCLDAGGETATMTLKQRTLVVDFADGTVSEEGETLVPLFRAQAFENAPQVTTMVLDDYGYLTATYNAKRGTFAVSGKLWDGTALRGTGYALENGWVSPVIVKNKARQVVSVAFGYDDEADAVRSLVYEDGKQVKIGVDGATPFWGTCDTADLKSKKFNQLSAATALAITADGTALTLEIPANKLKTSVATTGLVKFTIKDEDRRSWVCELLPVGMADAQSGQWTFRGLATGTLGKDKRYGSAQTSAADRDE